MMRFREEFGLSQGKTGSKNANGRKGEYVPEGGADPGFNKEDVTSLRYAIMRLNEDDISNLDPTFERELMRLADEVNYKLRRK